MAELQTIAHGEGLWDKKANSNFALLNNALEKMGGVVDQLHWTDYTTKGIVTGSLLQLLDSSGYTIVQIGNRKIIRLHLDLKATVDHTGYIGGEVTLPDEIAPGQPMLGEASNNYNWAYADGNKINFVTFNNDPAKKISAGDLLFVDKVYVM